MNAIVIFLLCTLLTIDSIVSLSCLDENGNAVDNFISIVAPSTAEYHVYDPAQKDFVKSVHRVDQSEGGAMMNTVNQIYKLDDSAEVMYGIYNDEPPPDKSSVSSTYAHAKGLLITDKSQGFWMVHSKPHWPNARSDGPAPFPDVVYAQSFFCVTLKPEETDVIASNLMVSRPYIFDKLISPAMASSFPNFNLWLSLQKSTTTSSTTKIQSYEGRQLHMLAKSSAWGMDLWDDLAASYFNTALNVETWRSGSGGRMGSICGSGGEKTTDYDIIEVSTMALPDGVSWKGTQDHSKWAAAIASQQTSSTATTRNVNSSVPVLDSTVVCIGDNNRMCSQEGRGGSALCIEDYDLWAAFNRTILTVEGCYAYDPCTGTSTKCYWCAAPSSPQ